MDEFLIDLSFVGHWDKGVLGSLAARRLPRFDDCFFLHFHVEACLYLALPLSSFLLLLLSLKLRVRTLIVPGSGWMRL